MFPAGILFVSVTCHISQLVQLAELGRCAALYLAEYTVESGQAGEAHLHRRFGHGNILVQQQHLCRLYTPVIEEADESGAAVFLEDAREMVFAVARHLRQVVKGDVVHIILLDIFYDTAEFFHVLLIIVLYSAYLVLFNARQQCQQFDIDVYL